jgi:hypothetical protein
MSITIKSATWGDEKSTTDITNAMIEKAKDGYLDMVADNSLVPAVDLLSGSKTVAIDDSEKTKINEDAVKLCGGNAQDQKCIDFQKNQLESSLLQKKVAESQSSANIVTGRRLTLTVIDANGVEKVIAIPDGQKVKMGEKPAVAPFKMPETFSAGTWDILMQFFKIFATITMTLLWVFSIVAPYRLFVLQNKLILAYVLTGLAILVPYSGLITTPFALAYFKYMSLKPPAKVVPAVL